MVGRRVFITIHSHFVLLLKIAVGKEGEVMERTARELYDKLKVLEIENTKLYFKYFKKQEHGDALHLAVYSAFEKIFKQ